MKHVNSQQIEGWLTKPLVEQISQSMRGWYGPPIPLANMLGKVWVTGDGDFVGKIRSGGIGTTIYDFIEDRVRRAKRQMRRSQRNPMLCAGFAGLSDLIAEATGGKAQDLQFRKAATTATTVGNAFVARNVGVLPSARGVGGSSGTGIKTTSATTGAIKFVNPASGDTLHITTITAQATAISSFLLFDCLWDMSYNHGSSTSTAIDSSNRPDRYQTEALAAGSFISGEITTALSATAHNITVTYVDQSGNSAEAAALYAAPASAVAGRTPLVAGNWFVPLNAGDYGVRYLTNIAQSTITSVTGATTWFIGHPLALVPLPIANMPFIYDGVASSFNLTRIYDDACLSIMTPAIATTGAITYDGFIKAVAG